MKEFTRVIDKKVKYVIPGFTKFYQEDVLTVVGINEKRKMLIVENDKKEKISIPFKFLRYLNNVRIIL